MNMNYGLTPVRPYAGTLADNGYSDTVGVDAVDEILFGAPVVREKGTNNGYNVRKNKGIVTFSAALGASNVVNGSVNGVAIAPVTYGVSETATLTAIRAAILVAVPAAVVVVDVATHSLSVKLVGAVVTLSGWSVTGGAAVTVTLEHTCDGVFAGIARHTHTPKGKYIAHDSVPCTRSGRIVALCSVAMTKDDLVYLDIATPGKITNVATGNIRIPAVVVEGGSDTCTIQVSGDDNSFFLEVVSAGESTPPVVYPPIVFDTQMPSTISFQENITEILGPSVVSPGSCSFEWHWSPSGLGAGRAWDVLPTWCRFGMKLVGIWNTASGIPSTPVVLTAGYYRLKVTRGDQVAFSDECNVTVTAPAP